MKIINTFWEQQNLGVTSEEIILDVVDEYKELRNYIENKNNIQYTVVKVPQPKVEYFEILQENGFIFRETLINMELDLNSFKFPTNLEKLDSLIEKKRVCINEIENICKEIRFGIFDTDRIALDKKFGISVSSNRYSNWIMNEYLNNTDIFQIYYKKNPIGFFGIKKKEDLIYDNFLAGIYARFKSYGFGFSIISKAIEEIGNLGGSRYSTHISSNNLSVIKLYQNFGFTTKNLQYIFIKHQ